MTQYFLKKTGLTEHEFVRVKIAWFLRFFYQLGWVVAWTIVTALFVESFGIHSLIYLFLGEAVLYGMSSLVASSVCRRCRLSTYTYGLIIGVCLSLLLAWGVGSHNKELFFLFILIAKSFFFTQLSIALYRRNEELFSPSEAIRLMPRVESSVTFGSLIGSALMVLGLSFVEASEVLFLWVIGLLAIGAITYFIPRFLHVLPQWHKNEVQKDVSWMKEVSVALKKLPFVRYMMLGVFVQAALFTFFDIQLTEHAQMGIVEHAQKDMASGHASPVVLQHLQASVFDVVKESAVDVAHHTKSAVDTLSTKVIMHETLAHDLGMLHLMFALLAVVFQFFITPFVLRRLGVIGSWMSYTGILFFSMIGMVLGYFPIQWASALRHGTHSLGESAYHVSFYSLSGSRREAVRLFLEGMIKPLGIASMATLLLVFPASVVLWGGNIVLIGILFLWKPMRRAFTHISHRNIRSPQNIEEKIHSIEVLGQKGHVNSSKILVQELRDMECHALVRQKIIATLTRIQDPEILSSYIDILNDRKEEDDTRIQVLDSLLKLRGLREYLDKHAFGQHHLLQTLRGLFEKTDHNHLKKLVVMNIFRHMSPQDVVPFFLETIAQADERLQSIYLRSSKVFNDPGIRYYLQPYLEADNSRIKGHAVIALWNFEDRSRLRSILSDLIQQDTEKEIIAALYAFGEVKDEKSRKFIESYKNHENEVIRLHADIALAKIGDESCVSSLVNSIVEGSPQLAQMALGMIDRVDDVMREMILQEMKYRVSKRVLTILGPEKVRSVGDLGRLQKGLVHELKRLYRLVGQFDDLVAMERHGV